MEWLEWDFSDAHLVPGPGLRVCLPVTREGDAVSAGNPWALLSRQFFLCSLGGTPAWTTRERRGALGPLEAEGREALGFCLGDVSLPPRLFI